VRSKDAQKKLARTSLSARSQSDEDAKMSGITPRHQTECWRPGTGFPGRPGYHLEGPFSTVHFHASGAARSLKNTFEAPSDDLSVLIWYS